MTGIVVQFPAVGERLTSSSQCLDRHRPPSFPFNKNWGSICRLWSWPFASI